MISHFQDIRLYRYLKKAYLGTWNLMTQAAASPLQGTDKSVINFHSESMDGVVQIISLSSYIRPLLMTEAQFRPKDAIAVMK